MNISLKNSSMDSIVLHSRSLPNNSENAASMQKEDIKVALPSTRNIKSELEAKNISEYLMTEEGKKNFSEVLDVANQIFFGSDSHFQFEIHDRTGRMMVKVVNNTTNKIIKELPPEKILNAVASIWELAGIIIDEKV